MQSHPLRPGPPGIHRCGMRAVLAALVCVSSPAWADDTSAPAQHALAMQAYETSHYAQAAQLLEAPCAANDARSLEVLGFMHWYGSALYGEGPWQRARGRELLSRAAEAGSEVARVVLHPGRRNSPVRMAQRDSR
ncbi:MAG: hypothetical protein ABIX46_00865 [Burkholderiaceae bacterium]